MFTFTGVVMSISDPSLPPRTILIPAVDLRYPTRASGSRIQVPARRTSLRLHYSNREVRERTSAAATTITNPSVVSNTTCYTQSTQRVQRLSRVKHDTHSSRSRIGLVQHTYLKKTPFGSHPCWVSANPMLSCGMLVCIAGISSVSIACNADAVNRGLYAV